ncbi:MAG: dihydroorotase [Candidatus Moraniibacteriota bacterium]
MTFKVLQRDSDDRIMKFSMRRPVNMHGHVRRGPQMEAVVGQSAAIYDSMIIMPNTGPVTTVPEGLAYRKEIVDALITQGFSPERANRFPRMTLYVHPKTSENDVLLAKGCGFPGFKFYPKNTRHGTTGSQYGAPSLRDIEAPIAMMEEYGVELMVHGESAVHNQILDLERHFVAYELSWVTGKYPKLKLSVEHMTAKEAVEFVIANTTGMIRGTITPQHLWYTINSLFEGGLRPFRYCLPVYKYPSDQAALMQAILDEHTNISAGDDTAPHPKYGPTGQAKLADCGCAGAYVAPVSLSLYAEAFDGVGALDQRFENFMSINGPESAGFQPCGDEIIIERNPWEVPQDYPYGDNRVVPLGAGETRQWQLATD